GPRRGPPADGRQLQRPGGESPAQREAGGGRAVAAEGSGDPPALARRGPSGYRGELRAPCRQLQEPGQGGGGGGTVTQSAGDPPPPAGQIGRLGPGPASRPPPWGCWRRRARTLGTTAAPCYPEAVPFRRRFPMRFLLRLAAAPALVLLLCGGL